jgi:hypothetical protein
MMVPQAVFAEGATPSRAALDVALSGSGTLSGVVVSAEGQPLDGAKVTLTRSGHVLTEGVTNSEGSFAVTGLRTGFYEVAVGKTLTPIRAWGAEVAPPAAKTNATIVVGSAVRGQGNMMGLDIVTLWTLGASTGALVLAAINQSDLNNIEDKLDELVSP